MIESNKLKKFRDIKHGFFNRKGGVSKGIYKSLNCGIGSNDNKKNVLKNLKIVSKKLGFKIENLILLKQIHSNKIYYIKKAIYSKLSGDGILTNKSNIALGILTADCAPVFFYDPKKKIIAAAHVGWKGAYKKIVKKIINFYLNNGSNMNDLQIVIGPVALYLAGRNARKDGDYALIIAILTLCLWPPWHTPYQILRNLWINSKGISFFTQ